MQPSIQLLFSPLLVEDANKTIAEYVKESEPDDCDVRSSESV